MVVDESLAGAALPVLIAGGVIAQVAAIVMICRDIRPRSLTIWDVAAIAFVIVAGGYGAVAFLVARGFFVMLYRRQPAVPVVPEVAGTAAAP